MSRIRRIKLCVTLLLGCVLTLTFQYIYHSEIILNIKHQIFDTRTITIPSKAELNSTAQILWWNSTGWIRWNNFCPDSVHFNGLELSTPSGAITIFIHDVKADKFVSGEMTTRGVWEADVIKIIHHFMSKDPKLSLIDIGSHIGLFSLMAARMGRQALAVDPLLENVQRLCKSIQGNKFYSLIKVFYVALSDYRKKVSFHRVEGNIGATSVLLANVSSPNSKFDANIIDAVLLDDILPLVPFKHAFLKIDVESHENSVFKGGDEFFNSIDIPYVLMEWFQHAQNPTSMQEIINFMTRHKYSAYWPSIHHLPLVNNKSHEWPTNVLWKKVYK